MALGNSIQCYITLAYTKRLYPRTTVTALSARTFSAWSSLAALIRIYTAYHISDPLWYQMSLWSYLIVLVHFLSEWLVFGTTEIGAPFLSPMIVASTSLIWMLVQWNAYVEPQI